MILGIIGGGQLGQMLAISAFKSGIKTICLDPVENCPASYVCDEVIVADFTDTKAIKKLSKKADKVIYEFENIPFEIVKKLKNIPSGYKPLFYSQHRIREKDIAVKAGLRTGRYESVSTKGELYEAINKIKYPAILKTCSFGYDGKNQARLYNEDDLNKVEHLLKHECILESLIDFDTEISVIVVRNKVGQVVTLPISENIHINSILHMSVVPNRVSSSVNKLAEEMAIKLANEISLVGILAVEMFVVGEEVYFNEMAPRPHNSGHYSIEGCDYSQFDLAIKAILNEELPKPQLLTPTVMVNILGQHMRQLTSFKEPDAYVHLYMKEEAKLDRKMGHITFVNKSYIEVNEIIKKYWEFK